MDPLQQLRTLVNDEELGDDAWGDYYLGVGIDFLEGARRAGNAAPILDEVDGLQGQARRRLLQVLASVPIAAHVRPLLSHLATAEDETAEVLIGELRSWPLQEDERAALREVAGRLRGRSRLLDMVIQTL